MKIKFRLYFPRFLIGLVWQDTQRGLTIFVGPLSIRFYDEP